MRTGRLKRLCRIAQISGCAAAAILLLSCSSKPKEHVTLVFQAGPLAGDQQAIVREILAAFEKQFPYIHVEPKFERFDRSPANPAAAPDVFSASADELALLASNEVAVDLTPMVTIDKKLLDICYSEVVAACKVDNRQVMMPVSWSTDVVFYNQDLLLAAIRENRIAVNMQDLDFEAIPKFAQAFIKKNGDRITKYALALPRPLLLIQSWGANPFAWNDVTIRNDLAKQALAFYASLVNEHHLAPAPGSPEAALGDLEAFRQQKIVFFVGLSDALAEIDRIREFKWDVAPVPKGPKRSQPGMPVPGSSEPPKPVEVWPRYARLRVTGNCVWSNSPHFAEAWELVKFCSSESAQRIFARGRNGLPAVKIVAESSEFLRKPPEHVDVLLSSRSYARLDNTHNFTFWDEFIKQDLPETTGQLLAGKLTVDQTIDILEGLGKDLLEKNKKKR